jgi:hypothetical protein
LDQKLQVFKKALESFEESLAAFGDRQDYDALLPELAGAVEKMNAHKSGFATFLESCSRFCTC